MFNIFGSKEEKGQKDKKYQRLKVRCKKRWKKMEFKEGGSLTIEAAGRWAASGKVVDV